jgi:hypothetical protein
MFPFAHNCGEKLVGREPTSELLWYLKKIDFKMCNSEHLFSNKRCILNCEDKGTQPEADGVGALWHLWRSHRRSL